MGSSDYHFVTRWRIHGSLDEVGAIIADALALPRWWPSVYLDVQLLRAGRPDGVGTELALFTKGFLPYTLRWEFRVTDVEPRRSVTLEARGDFVGRGTWTFAEDGDWTDVTYDWRVRAEKPLLRRLSFLMKPIFSANHHWAMARGQESLILELARRRAATPEARATVPPPPGPTSVPWRLVLGAGAAMCFLAAVRFLPRRTRLARAGAARLADLRR